MKVVALIWGWVMEVFDDEILLFVQLIEVDG